MRRRDFLRRGAGAGVLLAAGCSALPRSGPLTASMTAPTGPDGLEGLVAPLTTDIAEAAAREDVMAFPPALRQAGPIDPTRLGVDDEIAITIWESAGAGLFTETGGATSIPTVVDPGGHVFVPFAGPQRAAGATLQELRARIRGALEPFMLSPEVDVRLTTPRSRLVTLQGAVRQPGVYPIERATARLSSLVAQAGGATELPEKVEVAIRRHGASGRELLANVLADPALDIALRPGDQIVLYPVRERFIVLGASTAQAEIAFPTRPLDLLSAIATARGLRDFDADPTGVFVFRYEDPALADAVLPGPPPPGLPAGAGRPIVYRLDMSQPESLFVARRFEMRDGDAIFVTNAPLTEVRKFLQLFNAVVTPVNTAGTLPLQ